LLSRSFKTLTKQLAPIRFFQTTLRRGAIFCACRGFRGYSLKSCWKDLGVFATLGQAVDGTLRHGGGFSFNGRRLKDL